MRDDLTPTWRAFWQTAVGGRLHFFMKDSSREQTRKGWLSPLLGPCSAGEQTPKARPAAELWRCQLKPHARVSPDESVQGMECAPGFVALDLG
jgi:hypothetical protein